ncbi:hypothetical protein ARALYDRAFT_320269 [Arabidopsis lyrata subsp. lyrata]|uniref:Uncharacterized protein n=1 Tax=Arabidopsis lyrata subsp. lyrata TaxID=81972 RepID=D7LIA3_ARALL|nr:hypothetical protein ARALYDRAFT_320269 [Arabidopsis lyrata subsp. lyrata]
MASSVNGVVFVVSLMIVLLISTVTTYCEKIRSRSAPHDICKKKNGNALCKETCWIRETYQNGRCLILPKTTKLDCYCYHFDDGSKC